MHILEQLVEMFPELGTDQPLSGADAIDRLNALWPEIKEAANLQRLKAPANQPPILAALTNRLAEAMKKNIELREQKAAAMRIVGPFFDFMQNRDDITAGDSITKAAIRMIKERDKLLSYWVVRVIHSLTAENSHKQSDQGGAPIS